MKHVDIYLSEKSGNTLIYGIGKNVQLEMYVCNILKKVERQFLIM